MFGRQNRGRRRLQEIAEIDRTAPYGAALKNVAGWPVLSAGPEQGERLFLSPKRDELLHAGLLWIRRFTARERIEDANSLSRKRGELFGGVPLSERRLR